LNISILSIGDELLAGDTINTNSSWISRKSTQIGCNVSRQITCKDQKEDIFQALNYLNESQPEYIVITGGLGPTDDDITRKTLFEYFKVKEIFDEDYWQKLKRRFRKLGIEIVESNKSQAIKPSMGGTIANPIGSARGYSFLKSNTNYFSLPGVPYEMKSMMTQTILPQFEKNIKSPIFRKIIRTTGVVESTLAENISKITKTKHECKVGYYPSLHGVDIRISSISAKKVDHLFIALKNFLGDTTYTDKKINMEEIIVKNLSRLRKTIATAESCTGGLIGDRITNVPGASEVFKGGVITYSNRSKQEILGVASDLLKKYGAVSEKVAMKMSYSVMKKFNSDYGLSVTGIAGPDGGSIEKPVGTVFISLSNQETTKVEKFMFGKDREKNKIKTSQAALNMLRISL
jgi:nicotinamide-nucleotide amidase